ncbi:MAG: hypothetical protein J2P41_00115 [Blastocatellia bacterium]|nr:hypothetical protein [Blastocatellia bacterium]
MSKILRFRKRKRKMDNKRTSKQAQEPQQIEKETEKPKRDKRPLKKSVILPAYVWDALATDAELRRRTMAKQIEVILVNHYALDPVKIDIDDTSPGSFGYVINRASISK